MSSISIIGPENVALLQLGLVAHSVKHTNFVLGVNILS